MNFNNNYGIIAGIFIAIFGITIIVVGNKLSTLVIARHTVSLLNTEIVVGNNLSTLTPVIQFAGIFVGSAVFITGVVYTWYFARNN